MLIVIDTLLFRVPMPPGKSWKITLVLESPGKISLKVIHFLVVQMENKQQ